ncbi:DNA-directed RNA polymerase subunit alpha C-terminal domain-containing protein [Sphingomonas melonis]|uniref:RNA polymerase alpha subunit C-terminal domain-containing protein n=1 Tax=Sphingomonas melonis TaxID=152682 RepID=A0A7Y9JZV7_9SPHN|nr:DNA-directed RNA polymerase subunit alpha C-terminal domain-containing protein [Sphingomonas melonis]NYD89178.1 hypothetical protein [Sphingomonas melonis]
MSDPQQIIAVYDTLTARRSPAAIMRERVTALTDGPSPAFVSIDARTPYPSSDLGPPDWLIVIVDEEDHEPSLPDWRKVVEAAPARTRAVVMSYGHVSAVPRSVVLNVDMTGTDGEWSHLSIEAVARRVSAGAATFSRHLLEEDAVRRGALIDVGDGSTMLNPLLMTRIGDLAISSGTYRILHNENMMFLGDLVQRTEVELLDLPGLGSKRLGEIKAALGAMDLMLGATVPGWPPEDFETALAAAAPLAILKGARQVPSGEMFRPEAECLVIDPAIGELADTEVGSTDISLQLQEAVRRKLETLRPIAFRLGNQAEWQELAPLCERLALLLDRPGSEVSAVLGSLYASALELGSFAEMDDAARHDPKSMVDALDPSSRRPLQDVLTVLAPWLRRFPTVRDLDDDAGRFLATRANSGSARAAVAAAVAADLIASGDAARLEALLDAGERGGFVGGKAERRGIMSVRNLILAATSLIGGMLWNAAVNDYATHSTIARRAGIMLARAEDAVTEIASELPSDLRTAVRSVVADARAAIGHVSSNRNAAPADVAKPHGHGQ